MRAKLQDLFPTAGVNFGPRLLMGDTHCGYARFGLRLKH